MGSSGDILVGSVEPPALNRRLADPPPSRALNSTAPVFLEQEAGRTPAHPGRRDARSVCPGYARLRRACQRGCASSAQAGATPAHPGGQRRPQRPPWVRAPPARKPAPPRASSAQSGPVTHSRRRPGAPPGATPAPAADTSRRAGRPRTQRGDARAPRLRRTYARAISGEAASPRHLSRASCTAHPGGRECPSHPGG
jgi:hypothetical protein